MSIHPNGVYVATGSADSSIRMWSVTNGSSVRILIGHRGTILSLAFSPCGKFLASAGNHFSLSISISTEIGYSIDEFGQERIIVSKSGMSATTPSSTITAVTTTWCKVCPGFRRVSWARTVLMETYASGTRWNTVRLQKTVRPPPIQCRPSGNPST